MALHIIDHLASSLGKNDEGPNIILAEKIVKANDREATKELIGILNHKKSAVRSDAVKVVYEIAERKAGLIMPYTDDILSLLQHKDNRMKWGAMTALSAISKVKPESMAKYLSEIIQAMDTGTVITKDHGIEILCEVSKIKKHHNDCIELLLEQLEKAPVNQFPAYAEKIFGVISPVFYKKFETILNGRNDIGEFPAKQKRVDKILRKIASQQ